MENRALWFTNDAQPVQDGEYDPDPRTNPDWWRPQHPLPRSLTCWALAALDKARAKHMELYASPPHTAYLAADVYDRLIRELTIWQDCFILPHKAELVVLGMRIELEGD